MTTEERLLGRSIDALAAISTTLPGWALAADTLARVRALRPSLRPGALPEPRAFDRECEVISGMFCRMYERVNGTELEGDCLDLVIDAQEAFEDAYREFTGKSIHVMLGNESDAAGDDDEWRREMAMEAGMLHGVSAYNDMMGY